MVDFAKMLEKSRAQRAAEEQKRAKALAAGDYAEQEFMQQQEARLANAIATGNYAERVQAEAVIGQIERREENRRLYESSPSTELWQQMSIPERTEWIEVWLEKSIPERTAWIKTLAKAKMPMENKSKLQQQIDEEERLLLEAGTPEENRRYRECIDLAEENGTGGDPQMADAFLDEAQEILATIGRRQKEKATMAATKIPYERLGAYQGHEERVQEEEEGKAATELERLLQTGTTEEQAQYEHLYLQCEIAIKNGDERTKEECAAKLAMILEVLIARRTRVVYQAGYGSDQGQIEKLMKSDEKLLLVDVRDSPYSNKPGWNGEDLARKYGGRYKWLGKSLGNPNHHKPGLPIILAEPEEGLRVICNALRRGHPVIILCGCSRYYKCHRQLVIEELLKVWKQLHEVRLGKLVVKGVHD